MTTKLNDNHFSGASNITAEGAGKRLVDILNDGLITISQDAEPTLDRDGAAVIWIDTDGGPLYYLLYRVSSGVQVKVALS